MWEHNVKTQCSAFSVTLNRPWQFFRSEPWCWTQHTTISALGWNTHRSAENRGDLRSHTKRSWQFWAATRQRIPMPRCRCSTRRRRLPTASICGWARSRTRRFRSFKTLFASHYSRGKICSLQTGLAYHTTAQNCRKKFEN